MTSKTTSIRIPGISIKKQEKIEDKIEVFQEKPKNSLNIRKIGNATKNSAGT